MAALEERFTEHEGKTLRYLVGGSGPAMLLCHGFIGSAENFDDWFAALLPRRTVVAPDLPGFGRSAPLAGGHVASSMARAALSAADDAGIDEYDLAGLCLGGPVALAVQRARPLAAKSVILHTPLLAPSLVRKRFHLQAGFMTSRGVFPVIDWLSQRRVISDLYKRILIEGSDVDPRAAQVNFDNQMRAHRRASREWLRDGLRRDDLAQVRGSGIRVLILIAAEDRILHARHLADAVNDVPDIEIAVIEQGGHAWTASMLSYQRELLAAFLDGRPLPSQAVGSAAA